MAPPTQRRQLPKNDFAKYFSSWKQQAYIDPGTTRGSSGTIHKTIAWNNAGGLIATGASDRTIRVWNPERTNGRTQTELKGHTLDVNKVVFNPVKEFELASCSKDGSVRFWDTRSKNCVTSLNVGGDLFTIAWSVDGSAMVVGNKAEVLTTIDTRHLSTPIILEKHRQKLETNQTTFSNAYPPQDLLVTHGDGSVKVLDYPSFEAMATLPSHTSSCSSISYSPTGRYIAIGGSDAMIALWDTYDWACKRTMSNASSGKVSGLSWSWDGRYLAGSCDDTSESKNDGFEIYHAETGEVVYTVPTKTYAVPAVQWHPKQYVLAYTVVEAGKSSLKIIGADAVAT